MSPSSSKYPAFSFRNTCPHCTASVEIPVLSDFSYGEIILQTKDGRDFCIAKLIGNSAYDFITHFLERSSDTKSHSIEAQQILAQVADQLNGKELTAEYPLCPNCQGKINRLSTEEQGEKMVLPETTWHVFEELSEPEKIQRIKDVIKSMRIVNLNHGG